MVFPKSAQAQELGERVDFISFALEQSHTYRSRAGDVHVVYALRRVGAGDQSGVTTVLLENGKPLAIP